MNCLAAVSLCIKMGQRLRSLVAVESRGGMKTTPISLMGPARRRLGWIGSVVKDIPGRQPRLERPRRAMHPLRSINARCRSTLRMGTALRTDGAVDWLGCRVCRGLRRGCSSAIAVAAAQPPT